MYPKIYILVYISHFCEALSFKNLFQKLEILRNYFYKKTKINFTKIKNIFSSKLNLYFQNISYKAYFIELSEALKNLTSIKNICFNEDIKNY